MKVIGKNTKIESPAKIYNNVHIADNCIIGKYTYIRPNTRIYKHVSIGRFCAIAENVHIGATAHPTDWLSVHTFQYDNKTKFPESDLYQNIIPKKFNPSCKIIIGSDVWIGQNCIIACPSSGKKNITIGHGAILGANSVITKDVPPYAIVTGNNIISRFRFDRERISDLLELKWWELSDLDIAKIKSFDSITDSIAELKKIRKL
jgi:acetyltransferase-like isoleucine patch superfamily enzyme